DVPNVDATLSAPGGIIDEDTSVTMNVTASVKDTDGSEELTTITITGILPSWTLDLSGIPGASYNPATQTITISNINSQTFNGSLVLTPPADSDADMTGIVVTATAQEISTGQTASASD